MADVNTWTDLSPSSPSPLESPDPSSAFVLLSVVILLVSFNLVQISSSSPEGHPLYVPQELPLKNGKHSHWLLSKQTPLLKLNWVL